MKKKNVHLIERLANSLASRNVKFFFLDKRWKKRGDIDVVVAKKSLKVFDQILRENDFTLIGKWPPWKRFYNKFSDGEFLTIDVHVGKYEGSPARILEPEISKGYFLSTEKQLFYFIYRMGLGEPLWKYEDQFPELVRNMNEEKLHGFLASVFKNPSEIVRMIKENRFSDLNPKFKISHTLVRTEKYILNLSAVFLGFIRKLTIPAPYVAIVGPDGSGKSTTLREIKKIFNSSKFKLKTMYAGRFTFHFLPFNFIMKKIKSERAKDETTEKLKYLSPPLKMLAPFAYYIEYLLRYFLRIYPARVLNKIVITERGFLDIYTSPNVDQSLTSFFMKILPSPKHVLLWNSPSILSKRCSEYSKEDLERQLKKYNEFPSYILKLKTDDKKEIIEKVMEKLAEML